MYKIFQSHETRHHTTTPPHHHTVKAKFHLFFFIVCIYTNNILAQWTTTLTPSVYSNKPAEIGATSGSPNAWINTYSNNCHVLRQGELPVMIPFESNHIRMSQRGDLQIIDYIYDPNNPSQVGSYQYNCNVTTDYFFKTNINGSKLILDGIDKNGTPNQYMSFWENNIKIYQNTVLEGNMTINQDLTVVGSSNIPNLNSENITSTNITSTNLTTSNLTVTNTPIFMNGLKIKNSALQITDASNNIVWNFKEDGKLGIGVPSSEMTGPYWLWVKNGIMTERLKVAVKNTQDWKDYVFDKNYKLRTLDEVEEFIKTYKHLPEIPSVEEVVRDGIDVQTMDAKLLQKIEELTLYVIELKKEINQLKKKK